MLITPAWQTLRISLFLHLFVPRLRDNTANRDYLSL